MLEMASNLENSAEQVLQKLIWNFFSYHYKFSLEPSEIEILTWEIQEEFLKRTIKSSQLQKYPMSIQYTKLFFKNLVNLLQENQEIHGECYSAICTINNEKCFCYKHYLVLKDINNIITMKETNNIVVNGTTGMRTWDAAVMLADWALSNKKQFYDTNVLELGCGIGFTAIAIAKYCNVKRMWLTDYHETVLDTALRNIEINLPNFSVSDTKEGKYLKTEDCDIGVLSLDWNNQESIPDTLIPDVVIGADIVYDPTIMQPLCGIFNYFFKRNGNLTVYIQSVVRNDDTFQQFLDTLELNNLTYERLPNEEPCYFEWNQSVKRCLLKIQSNRLKHNK